MERKDGELEQALEELNFWRDYADWWRREHSKTPMPRLREALELAEKRYFTAVRLQRLKSP